MASITNKDAAIIRDMRDRLDRLEAIVARGSDNRGTTSGRGRPIPDEMKPRWFRITSSSQDGSNYRWVYTMTEVYKSSTAYNGWTDVAGGITTAYGYNGIEDQNGSSGTFGANIASTNLSGTFALKPLYNGCRVFAHPLFTPGQTYMEWWFVATNSVDGGC